MRDESHFFHQALRRRPSRETGPESANAFNDSRKSLPFIGLHASQHKALKLYGQETKIFKIGLLSTQAIIDKSDKIQFARWPLILDIPENKELLDLAQNAFTPSAAVH